MHGNHMIARSHTGKKLNGEYTMIKIMLTDTTQILWVQIWTSGAWRKKLRGQVIGSYDGIVGVLLDSGEYMDVPEDRLRIVS